MDNQAVVERDEYGRATLASLGRVFGGNCTILDAALKLDDHMKTSETMVVSVSGGSDSDIMLDMVEAIRPIHPDLKIHYVWFNTGMEYEATRRHLEYLEERYGIKIERRQAKVPVPAGCKKFGLPFLSKQVSQAIHRLQRHGFQWEDEPYDVLLAKYPKCASALKWWCGEKWDNRFTVYRNKWLKEFIVANPPDFEISDGCCHGAKKYTAAAVVKDFLPCIQCIGIRKAEGGLNEVGVLLFNHDTDQVIGKVVRAWVEDHRGMAEVEFDTDADAEKVFGKVKSGTLKTTSVRYSVDVWEEVAAGATSTDGRFVGPCQVARKWTPMEVSIVSVPADPSVGVGRANDQEAVAPLAVYQRQIQINRNQF